MSDRSTSKFPSLERLPAETLQMLLRVSESLTRSLDLEVVLQTAIEEAVRVLTLDTGAIYTLTHEHLRLGATTPPLPPGFPDELRDARLRDHPHIRRALETGTIVAIHDARTATLTPAEREAVDARGLVSLLYVPLTISDKPVGVLIIGTVEEPRTLDPEEVDLCHTLAHQIALSVENARLFDGLKAAHAEITRINAGLEETVHERTAELERAYEEVQCQAEELQCQAAELEEYADELARTNSARERFLRTMSHELRTPLNSVIGFSDLLGRELSGPLNEEQAKQVMMIQVAGKHLLTLVNDVLDLARIDAGVFRADHTDVNLVAVVRECIDVIQPEAAGKHIEIHIEESQALTVHTDEKRVRQVLINLVANAVRFTEEGAVTVCVNSADGDMAAVTVTDTGPGIPVERLEAIFEDFEQVVPPGGSSVPGSSGLGLAISRRLARALGGDVVADSTIGEGSTFTLLLPGSR